MRQLNRKLLRDLLHMKGQMLAVTAVVACGIAMFVSMSNVKYSLEMTRADYYSRFRFADLFVQLKRAPEFTLEAVRRIPGVATVAPRIVTNVTIDVPGLDEPVVVVGHRRNVHHAFDVVLDELDRDRGDRLAIPRGELDEALEVLAVEERDPPHSVGGQQRGGGKAGGNEDKQLGFHAGSLRRE